LDLNEHSAGVQPVAKKIPTGGRHKHENSPIQLTPIEGEMNSLNEMREVTWLSIQSQMCCV